MDERWITERLLSQERDNGATAERLRSVERADTDLRAEVRDGFLKQERALDAGMRIVGESVLRESAHTRGEIARLDTLYQENRRVDEAAANERRVEAAKRNEELLAELKAQAIIAEQKAKDAANKNRPFLAIVVVLGLFAQWVLENWSMIRNFSNET